MNLFNKNRTLIRPFTYLKESLGMEAVRMLILLCIQIALLFISSSFSAIILIACTAAASVLADITALRLVSSGEEEHFSVIISAVQGIIIGMLIPQDFPPATAFTAAFTVKFISRYFFNGFAYTWVNPAALTVVILWFTGARLFPEITITRELLSSKNPSQVLLSAGFFPLHSFDSNITEALNNSIFSLFKISIPEGYISMIWDNGSSIPAFRFNFVTLISSIMLFGSDTIKIIIPGFFMFTYLVLVRFVSPFFYDGIMFQGDMLLALFTGGTLFIAAFMLSWYGTIPCTIKGRILYGVFGGITSFFIAGVGTSSSGMIFAIVLTNLFSVIVQNWENLADRRALRKMLSEVKKTEFYDEI